MGDNVQALKAWIQQHGLRELEDYEFPDSDESTPRLTYAAIDDSGYAIAGIMADGSLEVDTGDGWKKISPDMLMQITPDDIADGTVKV